MEASARLSIQLVSVQLYSVSRDDETVIEEYSVAYQAIGQASELAIQEPQSRMDRNVNLITLVEKTPTEDCAEPEQKERKEAKPSAPKPEKNPPEHEKPAKGKDSEPKQRPTSEGREHQRGDGRHSEGKGHSKGHPQTHNSPADNSHHLPVQDSNQTGQPEQKSNECDQSKDSSETKETDGKKIDENEGCEKDIKEIARQIAKELIPEKFNFLIMTIPFKFHHSSLPKEEKEKGELPNRKNDANKSAEKGEGKTLEKGTRPEKLEPVQKVISTQPNDNAKNPQQFQPRMNQGKMSGQGEFQIPRNFVAQMGQSQSHLNFGKQGEAPLPNNPAFNSGQLKNQEFFGKQSYQNPPFLQTNYGDGGKMQNQSRQFNATMAAQSQPLPAGRGQTPVFNGNNPIPPSPASDLSKVAAKGANPNGKIEEVAGSKQVQPRRDAIPGIDRHENQRLHKHRDGEEGMPVLFPVLPDLPQSREGVLKDRDGKNNLNIRVDEGFRLGDLLLMLLCGVICNGRNAPEIAAYLQGREAFFKTWLGLKRGLPSSRLLGMLLNWLEPSLLEGLIHLALGKKTSSLQNAMVWESDRGIIIGELKEPTQKKSDSPLLEVMGHFDLTESLITIHADTLRKDFSRQIKASGGDYIIALKGKHGNPYELVQEFFYEGIEEKLSAARHQRHQDHIEEKKLSMLREILVIEDVSWFVERDGWSGLKSTIQFNSQTTTENSSIQETRYYLTSLQAEGELISQTLRTHSILETKAEWYLDFDFTHSSVDHKYENFDLLRSFSWDLLNSETSAKIGAEAKRKKAQIDNSYLRLLLGAA